MKKVNILLLSGAALLSSMLTGCGKDFLDNEPTDSYVAENYYSSDEAVMKAIEPLYNYAWFNYNYRAILGMGSYRANDAWNPYQNAEFAKFQVTALSSEMSNAWTSFYTVVSLANQLVNDVENNCTGVSKSTMNLAKGEALLMRAAAYFYLVRSWGPVIVYTDNVAMTNNPNIPLTTEEDVLKFIICDLSEAIQLLPEAATDHHATKYAAEAMLAKVLLAESGWNKSTRDEATLKQVIALCDDVISSKKYTLLSNYEDLWKYSEIDNNETVLAMRWADPLLGSWGEMNANYSDLTNICASTDGVSVWGGPYASIDMLDLYNEEPTDTIRLRATFFTPGRYYDYFDTGNDIVSVDDKTTANGYPQRSGYVYQKNHVELKKYVVGTKADCNGHLATMASPLNTYIMRMADVYLIKAEAALGNSESTTDNEGLSALNAVRNRAGLANKSSYTFEDLIKERRKEFCMEFSNWYDMVTWYRWKPDYMLDYFNNKQHRGFQLNNKGDGSPGTWINDDNTIAYCPIPPLSENSWYFEAQNVSYQESYDDGKTWQDVTDKTLYWFNDSTWRDVNGNVMIKYHNGEPGIYKVENNVWTKIKSFQGTPEYKSLDQMCAEKENYQPIKLTEASIFFDYPESDVLRNSYLKDRSAAKSYDFGSRWEQTDAYLKKNWTK